MKKLLFSVFFASILAACGSTTTTSTTGAPVEDHAGSGDVTTVTTPSIASSDISALTDPKSILSKREIFFDFDSFTIRPEFSSLIEAHARFLAQNPNVKMLIQGNTDDRGSREYNIALGQKRADAVKKTLLLLGAKENQIESVSLGKEKPRCTAATEECHAQNRRSDMLYSGEF